MMSNTYSTKAGDKPMDGSMHRSCGRAISARPMATHLLLAARPRARLLLEALLDARERAEDAFNVGLDLDRVDAREGAHFQIFEHSHARKLERIARPRSSLGKACLPPKIGPRSASD